MTYNLTALLNLPELLLKPTNYGNVKPKEPEKSGRATGGRLMLKDGSIVAGVEFILKSASSVARTVTKQTVLIRWILKETGHSLLKAHKTQVMFGEKIIK